MACLLFLKELRSGTIRELYTDYPIETNQLSLDILLRVGLGDSSKEKVYEVKTGESFKKDATTSTKTKGQSSEVRDVVLTFLEYSKQSPEFEGYISFSNGLSVGINNYLGSANRLRMGARLIGDVKLAAEDLIAKLNIKDLSTQRDIHKFFRRVRFEEEPYDNEQAWSTLDEHIRSEILEIAKTLDVDDHVHELPYEYLASKLLYTIQKHTGSGTDITKELLAEVMDFMYLRRLFDSHSIPGVREQIKGDARQYVKTEMINKFKVETLLPEEEDQANNVAVTDTGVGGTIE